MTIVVDIRPEVQVELSRQAADKGIEMAAYVAILLEDATSSSEGSRTLSHNRLDRTLQEMAQFSSKIPLLPDVSFSRENLYQDHD